MELEAGVTSVSVMPEPSISEASIAAEQVEGGGPAREGGCTTTDGGGNKAGRDTGQETAVGISNAWMSIRN